MLKKIPIPIAGVTLACFALANLLKSYHVFFYEMLSILGIVLVCLLTLKFIFLTKPVLEQMNHPVISSVAPTYSMALMLMSGYLKSKGLDFANILWFFALGLHILFIINYSLLMFKIKDFKKVFPSIFIVYVGIIVGSVTSPAFNLTIGKWLFIFGSICYLILLLPVLYRVIKYKLPEPAKPTFAIFAAPASLCLAGYMSAFNDKSLFFVWFFLVLGLLMTALVLFKLPSLLRLPFSPGYSAYTFPFVISAIGSKQASMYLEFDWLNWLVQLETVLAALLVVYVLIQFAINLIWQNNKASKKAA